MAMWVTLVKMKKGLDFNTKEGCLELERGESVGDALEEAGLEDWEITDTWHIPYPAHPKLRDVTGCPTFCRDPRGKCKGLGSCPMDRACSE